MKRKFGTLVQQMDTRGRPIPSGHRAALLITAVALLFLHRRQEARYAAGMAAAYAMFGPF